MKLYYLFLFIGIASFSQKHHFLADKNNLIWQIEFKNDAQNVLELIDKNHPNITTDKNTNTGKVANVYFNGFLQSLSDGTILDFDLTKTKDSYILTIEKFLLTGNKNAYDKKFLDNNFSEVSKNSGKQKTLTEMDIKLLKLLLPPGSILIE